MEIVWITEKVVDAEGVITHIDWTARAWESVYQAMRSGRAALPSPDPDLLAQYLSRNPEHGRYVFKRNEDDATGFVSADRIERDTLHPWLFELIDRGAIEAELVDEIRAAQTPLTVDTPSAAALVNAAEEGPREYPEAVAVEPDPRDEELKAALARAEAAEARVAVLEEKLDPPSLSPQPDAMMIPPDLAQLMMDREPLPEAITRLTPGIDELLDMAQALSDASMEQAIASFPEDRFEEWTERLWAEKARLRTKRGTDEENLSRENLISRVAGLFMRVGAKR